MSNTLIPKLALVGNEGGTNVGCSFLKAAEELGLPTRFLDARRASAAPRLLAAFNWRIRGHRPTHLRNFSRELVDTCQRFRPKFLLCTGLAPVEAIALEQIGQIKIRRLNYLTDDPWNPAQRAPWFLRALPHYDTVFSTRHSNLDDLRAAGCTRVEYLPFGFDPSLFFPEAPVNQSERDRLSCDVVFAGGRIGIGYRLSVPSLALVLKWDYMGIIGKNSGKRGLILAVTPTLGRFEKRHPSPRLRCVWYGVRTETVTSCEALKLPQRVRACLWRTRWSTAKSLARTVKRWFISKILA